jgi:hypothetical protein
MAEWVDCYENLLAIEEVDVIGIPKVLAKTAPGGRPQIVNEVCQLKDKPHHLLGLWYSIAELYEYDHPENIRSCDTVLLSYLAKHNIQNVQGIRPDGFTVNLEQDVIPIGTLKGLIRMCSLSFTDKVVQL